MKYVCFGYYNEEAWGAMSVSEQQRFMAPLEEKRSRVPETPEPGHSRFVQWTT